MSAAAEDGRRWIRARKGRRLFVTVIPVPARLPRTLR